MSLVGTRPILQDELRQYELHHRARIAIKPGITGMWQVSGRSDITDFEEVVRLDTEYISNWNFAGYTYFTFYQLLNYMYQQLFLPKCADILIIKSFWKPVIRICCVSIYIVSTQLFQLANLLADKLKAGQYVDGTQSVMGGNLLAHIHRHDSLDHDGVGRHPSLFRTIITVLNSILISRPRGNKCICNFYGRSNG